MNAPHEHAQAALQLAGYGVSFGARVVLGNVDLVLPPSGIDVLMGPVKAGKSTLLRSLAGLNQSTAAFRSWGQALQQGRPLEQGPRPALVQQHAAILNGNLRDALVYHRRRHTERSSAAWAASAAESLRTYGLGMLEPLLDQPLLGLPVEQQRAVNILSHALMQAPLLLVDEPTYGLDDRAATWLVDWLAQLGRTVRLVVVLHHQGQARRLADRVILLGGGRVLAHEDASRFFSGKLNAWVEQFVRTGSLAIASPDAKPEDLGPDVEPPPPLPAAALEAVRPFRQATPLPADAGSETVPAPAAPRRVAAPAPVAPRPTTLPPLSRNGVDDASMVGRVILSASRGPQGFCWIVPGKLAGCAEPGVTHALAYDLDLLARMGVTRLITLTEKDMDQDALAVHGLRNVHLPIFDREAPSLRQTYMLLRRMQALMDEGQIVAVHCKAGIGRTGTVLAAWMIREGGISASSALERLRKINPAYVQTEVQERFLHAFEQDILTRT